MSKRITFKANSGADASGVITEPAGAGKAPGLVLLQEYWGINDQIKGMTDRFAAAGFVVLTPDLYHGVVAVTGAEATKLMKELDRGRAMDEVEGAVELLKSHPRCNGKVGVVGFCMGGALAFTAACMVDGLDAVVPFYGVPDPSHVDYGQVTAPIQAHFANKDEWAKPASAQAVKAELDARGHAMELFLYDAGHAFMNDARPEAYDVASARTAWERATTFLKKNLA